MSPATRNLKNFKKPSQVLIRLAVVVGGLILLAAAGYFFLVAPKKNESKSLTQKIALLDQQISEQQAQATQAAGLSKILVADYNKLQTAMPAQAKMDEIFLQLNALAKDTGIRFDSVQPGEAIDTTAYQVLPIGVTFQGSFDKLSDFLYRLQSLVLVDNRKLSATGRLFTVDEVSFGQGEKGFPQIMATLQINAYAFGHPVATAANTAPLPTSTDTTATSTTGTSTTATTGATTPSAGVGTTTSATSGG
jgi:Tfp pilus assembly protein PilO